MLTQSTISTNSRNVDKSPKSRNIRIRPQKSIKNDVSPFNNNNISKEKDEDEEELDMQTISKGVFDMDDELDFKTLLESFKEKSPVKVVKGRPSKVSHVPLLAKKVKIEVDTRKPDALSIVARLKDTKALVEEIDKYQPKNSGLNMAELKSSSRMKLKRYKDCVYFGEIISSKRQGRGVMVYNDNRTYEGEWDNDCKHGKGFEILSNGNKYDGQFVNGKPDGNGTFYWTNGEIYEGQWRNGVKEGKGSWQGPKGECYVGDWKDGKADGFGIHTWKNGDKYEGEHKGFLKHGRGTETFANGDCYVGNYVNGKPDGYGEYKWANGCQYKGQFKNGLRHGNGLWKKGGSSSDSYDGEWVNDKKCGPGTYIWATGNSYRGEYFEDMRHGNGEMLWTDGSYYKGQWEKGVQQGEGELMIPNKALLKGRFYNNTYVSRSNEDVEEDEEEDVETPSARRNRNGYTAREPVTTTDADKETFPDIRRNDERSHSQLASKKSLVPSSSGNIDKNLKRDSVTSIGKKVIPNLTNLKNTSEPELPDFKDYKTGSSPLKKITYPSTSKTWKQAESSKDSQKINESKTTSKRL